MDPKVCGKLLTHHRRGNGVDVDALRDRIPLRQITGKGSKIGSHGNRGFRWRKSKVFSWLFLVSREYLGIYRPKNRVRRVVVGPQAKGVPPPRARPGGLWRHGRSPAFISKSAGFLLVQEKSFQRFYSVWTPFNIPYLQYSKTRKKQKLALGSRLIGYSEK